MLVLSSQAAFAQSTDAQEADQAAPAQAADDSGEILVTAQFREQRLQDTPIAITAVTGETLEARSQTSITDIAKFAPNVILNESSAINGNSITAFIRGIGQDDSSFAFEPGVGIYIDDVYYGTTFGAVMDLTDLERVEVLRGPQGTLAGKNSLGGAIKLYSRKPDAEGGGYFEASYGAYNRLELEGSAGFTVADGLYARFSGVARRQDGFFKELDYGCVHPGEGFPNTSGDADCVLGRAGGGELYAARGALRYAPDGSRLEINVSADVAFNDQDPVPTKPVVIQPIGLFRSYVPGNPLAGIPYDERFLTAEGSYTSYANYDDGGNFTTVFGFPVQVIPGTFGDDPKNTANSWGVVGTVDYEINDNLSVKSITAYRRAWGTSVIDIDGSPINLIKERLENTHEQFTQELRLTGQVGDVADFTVGGFYYDANDRAEYRIQIPILLYDFLTNDPVTNRSLAAFAHVELHLTDSLNVIGGLRYTDDKKTYVFSRSNADGSAISGIPPTMNFLVGGLDGQSATASEDRVDYRLGVNYRFSPEIMAYAQIATGYKGGGVNPRPFVPDQIVTFDPETLTTYEAGFKADLFDRVLRANAAVFYNEYNDIQRSVYSCPTSTSPSCNLPFNAGDGTSKGFELETTLNPVEGLTIDATVAYLDFDYDNLVPETGITPDMRAPFQSDWQASAGVQYEHKFANGSSLTPRVDWSYISDYYYQAINNPYTLIDGRNLFNARLSYESSDGDWTVSAAVTNLFDKYYYVATSENLGTFGLVADVTGRPREWTLSVRRRF